MLCLSIEVTAMSTELFSMYRGDSLGLRITVRDALGTAINISGWQFKSTMKLDFMADDAEATVAVDMPVLIGPDAEIGIAYLLFPAEQTKNLLPAKYFWDVQLETEHAVVTVIAGKVKVLPDATRRTEI